jgi:hypothetical protein
LDRLLSSLSILTATTLGTLIQSPNLLGTMKTTLRLTRNQILLAFVAIAIIIAVPMVYGSSSSNDNEQSGRPIQGAFAVTASAIAGYSGPAYCGGTAYNVEVEGHGDGYTSLGAMSFSLIKTVQSSGPAMHGCLTLTAANGDILYATYDGSEPNPPNAHGFRFASGTLTFTGGTGRFSGASGSATFTASFTRLGGSFTSSSPALISAYYTIQGNLLRHGQ